MKPAASKDGWSAIPGDRRRAARLVAVFLASWLVAGLAWAAVITATERGSVHYYADLQRYGVRTLGTVTSLDLDNHDQVRYTFSADGRQYSTEGGAGPPNPDSAKLRPGAHVVVVYDRRNPETSCACDRRRSPPDLGLAVSLPGGLFLGAIVAALVTMRYARRD